METKNIFIIGSNGIPAKYGGFETFVENLTEKRIDKNIKYHVSCLDKNNEEFEYNEARCFNIKVPNIGAAKAEYYDLVALERVIKYIKKNKIKNSIVYVLGTGVGLFIGMYKKRLHKLGAKLYVNPDGLEWKREKWNWLLKKFFKICEEKMAKHADLLICDSSSIEKYIKDEYKKYNPKTTFIAYGSNLQVIDNEENNNKLKEWYDKYKISKDAYYLIVGRFVPENNYKTMIKEFIKSTTQKSLVIITNVEKNKFYENLNTETNFENDKRIKFVGTVYDSNLLALIRQNAYGYIHGHAVGGTNPSLLEALSTTNVNLLYDIGFNKEVARESSLYWNKEEGNLSDLINNLENIAEEEKQKYGQMAKLGIKEEYNWEKIVSEYENIFLKKE